MTQIDVPEDWKRAATYILKHKLRKVLVLGAPDRGKSTFCSYLTWRLLQANIKTALIDADIGQKDLGPPATITLGYPRLDQALSAVQPAAMYFVGAVSPVAHLLPMVVGTRYLLDRADAPFVVINTSGLIDSIGKILKAYKIDVLRPDVIVAITKGAEMESILLAHRHFCILRLTPSLMAQEKSQQLRRQRRCWAFRRYFSCATKLSLNLEQLIVQRLPIEDCNAVKLFVPYRLCALADEHQTVLGLALVKNYHPTQRILDLWSPVPSTSVKILQLGDICLDPATLAF